MLINWILVICAVIIVAVLSVYAGMLLTRLQVQQKATRAAERKRLNYLHESIETIAKAMKHEQCALSEGCIRIAVLLDNLPDAATANYAQQWPALHAMYERIKHMPTHEARKEYPKKDIRQMDMEREGYEREMKADIQRDVQTLLGWIQKHRVAA